MLICGVEEPLRRNGMLDPSPERIGSPTDDLYSGQLLNRYSFMWLGQRAEDNAAYSQLIRAIMRGTPVTQLIWFLVYRYHVSGDYRIRSLAWLSRRKKEGWIVYHDDTLAIASKQAEEWEAAMLYPPGYGVGDGNLLLVIGQPSPIDVLTHESLRSTVQQFAQGGALELDTHVLAWLTKYQLTVAYQKRDDLGRWGLIMLSPVRIPTSDLLAQGIIQEIKTGAEAETVWRFSWKYGGL